MGDVVHALPLVADLAQARPGAVIDWVVEESFADIPAMSRHVARVHQVALRRWRKSPLSAQTRAELSRIRRQLRDANYSLVLDAQGLLKSAWIARWSGAPVAGFSSNTARERLASLFYANGYAIDRSMHAIDRVRELGACALGYSIEGPPRFELVSSHPIEFAVATPYAMLLVNASRASKLWPDENWIELERWLAVQGLTSLLPWGNDAERRTVENIASAMQRAVVVPRSSIATLASVITSSTLVIGLDTGLSHLSAALGRPTVAIYCDYDPRLVGLVGTGPVASLGGVSQQPPTSAVIDVAKRMLESAR